MSAARGGPIALRMARTAKASSGAVGAGLWPSAPAWGGHTMLRVARYGKTRFWALWDGNDLVAVVVYKKGAVELLRRLAVQAPAATEAAAQQAQALAAQARALAQQAQAAARVARARAQPARKAGAAGG